MPNLKVNKSDGSSYSQSSSSSFCNILIKIRPPKNGGNCQQHQKQRPLAQLQKHQQEKQFNNKFALFPPVPFRHRHNRFLFSLPSLFLVTFPLTILLRLNGIVTVAAGGNANSEIVAIRTLGDGPLRQWRPDRMIK
jgi:hypothetical protein